jgi:peptidoglycan/LPS O-acetylase OafA/YrhL
MRGTSASQDSAKPVIARLDWLDYLRLACALIVMVGHYFAVTADPHLGRGITGYGIASQISHLGTIALFVFLMMSGMVITMVAQRETAATFVARRVARVYPTFLICMTITALLTPFGPEHLRVSLPQYLANVAINAPAFGHRYVDAVYWTLVIEITFYLSIVLVILTGAIRHIQRVVTIWITLQLACTLVSSRLPILGLDYAFLGAGAALALYYQRGNDRVNLILVGASLIACLRCTVFYSSLYQFNPFAGSAMTMLAFGLFLFMRGRNVPLPFARRIGSMTYVLYLLHFCIGLAIFYQWVNDANKWWMVAGVSLLMITIAFAFDDLLEFRLRPLWIRLASASIARPFAWLEGRLAGPAAPAFTPIAGEEAVSSV